MDNRTLELTIISAEDLKRVSFFSKMEVYAVVSLLNGGHKSQDQRTHVDKEGRKNPTWNFPAKFAVSSAALGSSNRLSLLFQLRCCRFPVDKVVGEVVVPLSNLLAGAGGGDPAKASFVSYQVKKPSGKPKGVLHFSFKFTDGGGFPAGEGKPAAPAAVPCVGSSMPVHYQHPPPASWYPIPEYGYPVPPVMAVGHGYPVQEQYGNGYGYGYGYRYPPMHIPQNKNNFRMGMGAGILGGALAGILIGDVVSDVAFDGGFDFGGF